MSVINTVLHYLSEKITDSVGQKTDLKMYVLVMWQNYD